MGKGDVRTRRGKISRGTTGNSRPKYRKRRRQKKQQSG
ncbi:MAG: 30S ribosomal protein THX [Gammaproteobacteria bacterium]|nr:30S ribosomal protein THX [Gammaproteobacteria bacterium]